MIKDIVAQELSKITGTDLVNHPPHYTKGAIECIEAIEECVKGKPATEAYLVGNILKYIWRYENKGGIEDVKKAQWYLNRLIEKMSK